jgi:hypothetical protein
MLWRGALDWPQFLTGRSMVIAGGMAAKFVLYPIAAARARPPLTNWAVLAKVGEGGVPPRKEDWSRPGRFEDLSPHLQRFRIPYVDAQPDRGDAASSGNIRCATAIRCRAGRMAASRCSATPRIRCIRSARTAPRRRSSMRAASPTGSSAPSIRCTRLRLRAGAPAADRADRAHEPQGRPEGVIDAVERARRTASPHRRRADLRAAHGDRRRGYASTAGLRRAR